MKTIVDYASKVKEQHALNKTLAPVETDLTDASRTYAIGEQFIYDGDLFKAKTAIAQHDALVLNTNYEAADDITTQIKNKTVTTDPVPTEGSTNPVQSNGVFVENRNIYEVMGALGAKNYLQILASGTATTNGVTFVVNDDGTITVSTDVNGATADTNYYLNPASQTWVDPDYPIGNYILSGCPAGGSAGTYRLALSRQGASSVLDTGAGTTFTHASGVKVLALIQIGTGTVLTTPIVFKPMIRLATDTDNTFQPYAKTNQQLTAENEALTKEVTDAYALMGRNGAKNHVHVTAISQTINGVTFTVNDDGSIKANGTATEFTAFDIETTATGLKAVSGNYLLSDGLANPSASHYTTITVVDKNDVTTYDYANTKDAGKQAFSIVAEDIKSIYLAVCIGANVTVNDLVFYPMVRDAEDIDSDFQPYAKTNQQLTAENQTLTQKAYLTDDATETALASDDVVPFYDTSASAKKKMTVQKMAEQLISNRNLLDNGWFTVNQRGITDFTPSNNNQVYTLDRWSTGGTSAKITVNNGYITKTRVLTTGNPIFLRQKFDGGLGAGTYTVSIKYRTSVAEIPSGEYEYRKTGFSVYYENSPSDDYLWLPSSANWTIASKTFTLASDVSDFMLNIQDWRSQSGVATLDETIDIMAVKIEVGSVSTLASDTAPNYTTELLKCQRYYITSGTGGTAAYGFTASTTKGYIYIPIAVKMRATPTVESLSGHIYFNGSDLTISSYQVVGAKVNSVQLEINVASGLQATETLVASNLTFALSADL